MLWHWEVNSKVALYSSRHQALQGLPPDFSFLGPHGQKLLCFLWTVDLLKIWFRTVSFWLLLLLSVHEHKLKDAVFCFKLLVTFLSLISTQGVHLLSDFWFFQNYICSQDTRGQLTYYYQCSIHCGSHCEDPGEDQAEMGIDITDHL